MPLGDLSRFAGYDGRLFDAAGASMGRMGDGAVGEYALAEPVVYADLVVDMAKSKVHCSAGTTLALKNLLGIVPSGKTPGDGGDLKLVPHYSAQDDEAGRRLRGNGTIGRTAADTYALARYVARDGTVQKSRQRRTLCVVDGIVSGARDQFDPQPVATGWIAAGEDPVAVDHVAARCQGFDPVAVVSLAPSRSGALSLGTADPASIRVAYAGPRSFAEYFTRDRALRPESVTVDWGDSISLGRFALAPPRLSRSGDRFTVNGLDAGTVVRVVSGESFIPVTGAGGAYTFDLAGRAGRRRDPRRRGRTLQPGERAFERVGHPARAVTCDVFVPSTGRLRRLPHAAAIVSV